MIRAISLCVILYPLLIFGQNYNGQLDQLEEFTTPVEVPFTMPDGIKLMTNIYMPIVQDCLMVNINIPLAGNVSKILR